MDNYNPLEVISLVRVWVEQSAAPLARQKQNTAKASNPCSDYKKICEDNIRRRGEKFDDIGRLLSEEFYSDRSHFVYELLQNAEDALKRRFDLNESSPRAVEFRLFEDKLEFRHFGVPFNEEDVKGVSDVLKGTKTEDSDQIGKFGIGFKSVYAFTASPEIHSGDEHFVIKRYIRPEQKLPNPGLEIESGETVFIFPFNHAKLSQEDAFVLISNTLQKLGPRVLLFLRWIEEIKWCVEPDKERRQYRKETKTIETVGNGPRVTVMGRQSEQDDDESWLIFERPVRVSDKKVSVEVGFRLKTNEKDKKKHIVRENDSRLVVYFPTEKDTNCGFLIQGPYRTTPARDNILKDDAWNKRLIKETAELVVEALRQMKKMDLLSVSLLNALPIRFEEDLDDRQDREDSLRKFYEEFYPIFDKVRAAFMTESLLPSNDGTFVAAPNAKLVRGTALMKILNQEQLRVLFKSDDQIKWLPDNITADRTRDLHSYLMNELDVEEVDPEYFAYLLSEQFLTAQNDKWFIKFYEFLSDHKALLRPPRGQYDTVSGILRNKPILRLQNKDQLAKPFRPDGSPNAYLAVGGDKETPVPIVKVEISENEKARHFLKELGIPEVDIVAEVIENVLPKYKRDPENISIDENKGDLKKIEQAYKTDSQEKQSRLHDELLETPFIRANCPNEGKKAYRKPDDVYFKSNVLCMYFSGDTSFSCVSLDHPRSDRSLLFKKLGVEENVRVHRKEKDFQGFVSISNEWGRHERGWNGFDPGIKVDGLESAISTPSLEKSAFIWNKIAIPHSDCIRGVVEKSGRQTYEDSDKEPRLSPLFGELLTKTAWLPDSNEDMYKPSDLALKALPESFTPDEKLADQLGMKKDVFKKLVEESGMSEKAFNLAKQISESPPEVQERIASILQEENEKPPQFPQRKSGDPERRQKQIAKEIREAPKKKYKRCSRSIRITVATEPTRKWLKENYTNEGQMICQICKKVMPFKKRGDEYYFEAIEALSKEHFPKEHEAQFLSLCPLCAAMYKEFVKGDKDAMQELKDKLLNSDNLDVPLVLGELGTTLRFVESHWMDMKTILEECG